MNEDIYTRQFLCFEIGYRQWLESPVDESASLQCRIGFGDVLTALCNAKENRTPYLVLKCDWCEPLLAMGDSIGLPEALGYEQAYMKDIQVDDIEGRSPLNRENTLHHIFGYILHGNELFSDEASYYSDLCEWIEMMRNVLRNEELPISEWQLTMMQKIHFLLDQFQGETIDLLDHPHQILFQKCLDECCENGVYEAMRIKAFITLDGNSIYPKDRQLAKEYFEILAEEIEDPMAANALGDICLEEEYPQYEQAYKWYSFGAFSGVYESAIRVSDLLKEGKGIVRNIKAAYNQVVFVYTQTKQAFTEGVYSIAFADAAVRMGDYWYEGEAVNCDRKLAYSYYLDAWNAIRQRMRYDKCRGDDALYDWIKEALLKCEEEIPGIGQRTSVQEEPLIMDRMLSGGYPLRMTVEHANANVAKLVFSRIEENVRFNILLTIEDLSYSMLKKTVTLHAVEPEGLDEKLSVVFDRVGYDYMTGETLLYLGGDCVLSFRAKEYVFEDERPHNWNMNDPKEYVSVQLENGQRCECLCDVPGLKRGDPVAVAIGNGEMQGMVINTFRMYPYEMKTEDVIGKVLRKVTFRMMA